MANMLYNGVELPNINDIWTNKTTYPYAKLFVQIDGATLGYPGAYVYRLEVSSHKGYAYYENPEQYIRWEYNEIGTWRWAASYYITDPALQPLASQYLGKPIGCSGEWGELQEYRTMEINNISEASWNIGLPLLWTSHNILNTDNSVYLAASDPVDPNAGSHVTESSGNGFALYNGVKLPNIDTVWTDKTTYPYACIVKVDVPEMDGDCYCLIVSDVDEANTGIDFNGSIYYCATTQEIVDAIISSGLSCGLNAWAEAVSGLISNFTLSSFWDNSSDPIPLDGYTVIEWNGKTGGLTSPATNFYVVSQYVYPTNALAVVNNAGTLYVGTTFAADSSLGMWVVTDGEGGFSSNQVVADSDYGISGYSNDGAYTALIAYKIGGDLKPVYLRINGAWVKQTAYERQNGEWVLISTREKTLVGYSYNGVRLPKLPESSTARRFILKNPTFYYGSGSSFTMDGYVLATIYIYNSPASVTFSSEGKIITDDLGHRYKLNEDAGEWGSKMEFAPWEYTLDSSSVVWAEFDIHNADGTIFLAASEPVPVYE